MSLDFETRQWLDSHFKEIHERIDDLKDSHHDKLVSTTEAVTSLKEKVATQNEKIVSLEKKAWQVFLAFVTGIISIALHLANALITSFGIRH